MTVCPEGTDQQMYHFLFMLSAEKASIVEEKGEYLFLIKNADPKVLFMTARPGRTRAFVPLSKFMKNWIENDKAYTANPPHIAIIHSDMQTDKEGIAKAIQLEFGNPTPIGTDCWQFSLKFVNTPMNPQEYKNITLFIDWLPALVCPEPIRVQVPSLISKQ